MAAAFGEAFGLGDARGGGGGGALSVSIVEEGLGVAVWFAFLLPRPEVLSFSFVFAPKSMFGVLAGNCEFWLVLLFALSLPPNGVATIIG